MSKTTHIVFMGTPAFAVPSLGSLLDRYTIVGVVTQPDRPAGRGRERRPSPVKKMALAHDLPLFQPHTLRKAEAIALLENWAPDVIVTAAIGHILTTEVLAVPTIGTVNVHASLLPRWRGAAPIQAALLAGDAETGITIMCTDEGLDTGPILSQRAIPIAPRETAASLHDKLAHLGAELLVETLPDWISGDLAPRTQPAEGVTVTRQVRKENGLIEWEKPALKIDRQVRAYTPWPGAFTFWHGQRLMVTEAFPLPDVPVLAGDGEAAVEQPSLCGTVVRHDEQPAAVTGEGLLRLDRVQLASKRAMSGVEFVRGRPDFIGSRLGAKA